MVSPAQTFGGRDLYPEIADKAARDELSRFLRDRMT
jgi:hypothetical protein